MNMKLLDKPTFDFDNEAEPVSSLESLTSVWAKKKKLYDKTLDSLKSLAIELNSIREELHREYEIMVPEVASVLEKRHTTPQVVYVPPSSDSTYVQPEGVEHVSTWETYDDPMAEVATPTSSSANIPVQMPVTQTKVQKDRVAASLSENLIGGSDPQSFLANVMGKMNQVQDSLKNFPI